jgi:hypothetical protein
LFVMLLSILEFRCHGGAAGIDPNGQSQSAGHVFRDRINPVRAGTKGEELLQFEARPVPCLDFELCERCGERYQPGVIATELDPFPVPKGDSRTGVRAPLEAML